MRKKITPHKYNYRSGLHSFSIRIVAPSRLYNQLYVCFWIGGIRQQFPNEIERGVTQEAVDPRAGENVYTKYNHNPDDIHPVYDPQHVQGGRRRAVPRNTNNTRRVQFKNKQRKSRGGVFLGREF